ncbi:TPA: hypothetical protein IP923_000783 [Listeria monocytogenes]|nr:hypothetical protein [Listeria monocytogenes]
MAEDSIDKMKTSSGGVRLVLVGGGSVIILDEIPWCIIWLMRPDCT